MAYFGVKFDWARFTSRVLKLSSATDMAYLPNHKEAGDWSLVVDDLRRFPMQPDMPAKHPDLTIAHEFTQRFPGLGPLLHTDAAFEKAIRAAAIDTDETARWLRRYLAEKLAAEQHALRQLSEEAWRMGKAFQRQKLAAIRNEARIAEAMLEEHDRRRELARGEVEKFDQRAIRTRKELEEAGKLAASNAEILRREIDSVFETRAAIFTWSQGRLEESLAHVAAKRLAERERNRGELAALAGRTAPGAIEAIAFGAPMAFGTSAVTANAALEPRDEPLRPLMGIQTASRTEDPLGQAAYRRASLLRRG